MKAKGEMWNSKHDLAHLFWTSSHGIVSTMTSLVSLPIAGSWTQSVAPDVVVQLGVDGGVDAVFAQGNTFEKAFVAKDFVSGMDKERLKA